MLPGGSAYEPPDSEGGGVAGRRGGKEEVVGIREVAKSIAQKKAAREAAGLQALSL